MMAVFFCLGKVLSTFICNILVSFCFIFMLYGDSEFMEQYSSIGNITYFMLPNNC